MKLVIGIALLSAVLSSWTMLSAKADDLSSTDRVLLADSHYKHSKKLGSTHAQRYKTVENEQSESSGGNAFKGRPFGEMNNLSLGVGLDYFDSFGFAGRYAYKLADYVIPDINNSLYLEGGLGLTFYGTPRGRENSVMGFNFLVGGRWDFQMNPNLIFFGVLGLGYNAVTDSAGDFVKGANFNFEIGAGALYNLTPEWAVRVDVGTPFTGIGALYRF